MPSRSFLTRLPRHLLVWVTAVLLCALAAITAIGQVTKYRGPQLVPIWPADGAAFAAISDRAVRASAATGSRAPADVGAEIAELARAALAVEPTSAAAVRTLALHHQTEDRPDQARRLMQLASALTKRDALANLWLIDDYGRSGDVDAALRVYDHTLRTIGNGRGPVLTTMAAFLSDERLIEPFYRLLRTDPPWAASFWHVVAQMPSALENAGTLRIRLARSGIGVPADKDEMLLSALATQRKFDIARLVYAAIRPTSAQAPRTLLNNDDFSRPSVLAPFDWRLASSGELGAGINAGSGRLEISAIAGAKGEVARQLVLLEPARYELAAAYQVRTGNASDSLRIDLVCAEAGASERPVRSLAPASTGAPNRLDLSGESCRNYWLVVVANADEPPADLDMAIDRLNLTRISPG